jgi:hypothetical protein
MQWCVVIKLIVIRSFTFHVILSLLITLMFVLMEDSWLRGILIFSNLKRETVSLPGWKGWTEILEGS